MQPPQHNRPSVIVITREESRRVDSYVMRVGRGNAIRRLGCGEWTLESAMDQGRMMSKTRDRLFAALDREEAQAP